MNKNKATCYAWNEENEDGSVSYYFRLFNITEEQAEKLKVKIFKMVNKFNKD